MDSAPVSESEAPQADQTIANTTPKIHFDLNYIKTYPALLKIAEICLCLIGLICVQTIYEASQHSAGHWYYFVSVTGFFFSLLFLLAYTFHVVERFQQIPWLAAEMGYAAVWALFFFIAAYVAVWAFFSLTASSGVIINGRPYPGKNEPAWIAAAATGFVAMCIYGYEAFQKYDKWHKGDVPQGDRRVTNDGPSSPANEPAT